MAQFGYRTADLEILVEYGGCNTHLNIDKRKDKEEPIFYAEIYKNKFLDAVRNCIDFSKEVLTRPRGELSFPYLPEALK